jgi:hypothetical protein
MTMFIGTTGLSDPAGPAACDGLRAGLGKMPRVRNAESIDSAICACFFWSAVAEA